MKILVKGNITALEGIGFLNEGAVRTVTEYVEGDYDLVITGDIDVKSIFVNYVDVEVHCTGYIAVGVGKRTGK